jgi:hypothetical protein
MNVKKRVGVVGAVLVGLTGLAGCTGPDTMMALI